MEMSPEPGNVSPFSFHTCKITRPIRSHSSNDQLHIPLVLGSWPQEQISAGAQDQISVCLRHIHTQPAT